MSFTPHIASDGYQFSQGAGYVLPEYAPVVPDAVRTGFVEHHRILIVGGGLTGLTLACSLAQLGVDCVLLDEDNTVGVKGASSRGICYTQKSLEIFDKLGIYDRIKNKGVQWSVGRTFAGNDEVYSFDLKAQAHFSLSQQPAFINIQQFYNEGFLVERIQQLGHAQIRWNNRVTLFTNAQGTASFTIATPGGSYQATADYVIDATGSKSPFRQWLNVGVTAKKGDDRWCIADVRFNTHPPLERHTWIEAPFNDNRAVWQHLMADDVWRIDYQMAPDADPEYVSRESVVRSRLAKQFGADTKVDIVWVGPYAYRSECVDAMRVRLDESASVSRGTGAATAATTGPGHSQVFFIGDSAKVVSPFGARGGNTGIADADNLAWKLAAVVQGHAAPALLDSYHPERHEAATTNVRVTNRTARFLRPADGVEKLFRTATIALAKQHPFARALVDTGRMAVANPYSASPLTDSSVALCTSVQNVALLWAGGGAGARVGEPAACLNALLRWAGSHPLLLVFGNLQGELGHAQANALRQLAQTSGVRVVQVLPALDALSKVGTMRTIRTTNSAPHSPQQGSVQAKEAVIDPQGQLRQACGMPALAVLGARNMPSRTPQQPTGQPTHQPSMPPSQQPTAECHWALLRPDSYLAAQGSQVGARLVQAIALLTTGARP